MSWLDRFSGRTAGLPDGDVRLTRKVAGLLDQHRYREAAAELEGTDTPVPTAMHERIARAASEHWLGEAEGACTAGDRDRMNAALAEAARWYSDDLGPLFRDTRRRIRQHTLELTSAGHWVALLRAAADQRNHARTRVPEGWRAFANPRLLEDCAGLLGGTDPEALERADRVALEACREALVATYPEPLHADVRAARPDLVRAALLVAACRPDLAVLPLLELPDSDALVCLERGRVAFALGFPATALLALGDFAANHGQHLTVRRLNTGVFMAQMAVACGDEAHAVEILAGLPLESVGRRPVLLYARLLARVGRGDDGADVLDAWLVGHPDDDEAVALRQDLAGPDPTEDGLIVERTAGPS